MKKIGHDNTVIQTTFNELDDDGNVVAKVPLQLQIKAFTEEEFTAAFNMLVEKRKELAGTEKA